MLRVRVYRRGEEREVILKKSHDNMEESVGIARCLTFVGGYLNAYCFFTRGGSFGTFHTGNIVRVGLAVVQTDPTMLWSASIPLIGAVAGGLLSNALQRAVSDRLIFQRRVIFMQLVVFLAVGLLFGDSTDGVVNFIIPMVSMFQLSSFRRAGDRIHNSTIMTGNLRTLTQLLFEMVLKRDRQSTSEFLSYFLTFISFLIGVVSGGVISSAVGKISVWVCAAVMALILFASRTYRRAA